MKNVGAYRGPVFYNTLVGLTSHIVTKGLAASARTTTSRDGECGVLGTALENVLSKKYAVALAVYANVM